MQDYMILSKSHENAWKSILHNIVFDKITGIEIFHKIFYSIT